MERAPDDQPTPDPAAEVARLANEAIAHRERGALYAAEAPLLRALELAETAFGPDHHMIAYVLSHLGFVAVSRGMNEQAAAYYRRALAIREAHLGPDHPETLHSVEELAGALFQADAMSDESDALALRAIAGYDALGRDDAALARLIGTLAWRRYWVGRHAEAEPLFLRALAMYERLLGPGDPATAGAAISLAMLLDHGRCKGDPEPAYRKALIGHEIARPDDSIAVVESRFRFASYLHRQGRDDEAAPLFGLVEKAVREGLPFDGQDKRQWFINGCHEFLCDVGLLDEADALDQWAGPDDALLAFCQSNALRIESVHGPESLELAVSLRDLAFEFVFAGQADQAEAVYRRVLAILQARLGPGDPKVVEAARDLERVREDAARLAPEQPARRRARKKSARQFDGVTTPWRDERRSDLIRAYLKDMAEDVDDDPTGASMAITSVTFMADLDEQWGLILELIAESSDQENVLGAIAAGPLEGFLGMFDQQAIDRVEAEADRDPKFRRVLSGVWKNEMSDLVWERVRTIQATVPNPLPSMLPFAAESRGPGDSSDSE